MHEFEGRMLAIGELTMKLVPDEARKLADAIEIFLGEK